MGKTKAHRKKFFRINTVLHKSVNTFCKEYNFSSTSIYKYCKDLDEEKDITDKIVDMLYMFYCEDKNGGYVFGKSQADILFSEEDVKDLLITKLIDINIEQMKKVHPRDQIIVEFTLLIRCEYEDGETEYNSFAYITGKDQEIPYTFDAYLEMYPDKRPMVAYKPIYLKSKIIRFEAKNNTNPDVIYMLNHPTETKAVEEMKILEAIKKEKERLSLEEIKKAKLEVNEPESEVIEVTEECLDQLDPNTKLDSNTQ